MPWTLIVVGCTGFCATVLLTPFLSDPSYDWQRHTLSQLGGQGMPGAAVMNLGFALLGISVTAATVLSWGRAPLTEYALLVFGLGFVGAALCSTGHIDPSAPLSQRQDMLHSVFAMLIGFAFAAATLSRLIGPQGALSDWISWLGLIASVALPLAMANMPEQQGLLQRIMFAISLIWLLIFFARVA